MKVLTILKELAEELVALAAEPAFQTVMQACMQDADPEVPQRSASPPLVAGVTVQEMKANLGQREPYSARRDRIFDTQ